MDSGVPHQTSGLSANEDHRDGQLIPLLPGREGADNGHGDGTADSMTLLHEPNAEDTAAREAAGAASVASAFHQLLAPLAGGAVYTVVAAPQAPAWLAFLLAVAGFGLGALLLGNERRWTPLLPFMAAVARVAAPVLGGVLLAGMALVVR